ncbi:hypothetical protein M404DRAFT_17508 [Pisolithus tinctorius Marx 270]|uniref:Uncharacterized protein n=1 Tax=Pisolithus tinctorius Marx 270 TaxID=870435 RepID=A0A0C3JZP7_PISTI|nr:hypothetical protein M404DRAFT_17508 [Pisolithus tinctorius Marx 270]
MRNKSGRTLLSNARARVVEASSGYHNQGIEDKVLRLLLMIRLPTDVPLDWDFAKKTQTKHCNPLLHFPLPRLCGGNFELAVEHRHRTI